MISNSIRFVSVFSATLLAIVSLTGTLQVADAQENQTAASRMGFSDQKKSIIN
jgi:hypothetical protein